jgi:hypothetical protein
MVHGSNAILFPMTFQLFFWPTIYDDTLNDIGHKVKVKFIHQSAHHVRTMPPGIFFGHAVNIHKILINRTFHNGWRDTPAKPLKNFFPMIYVDLIFL